MSSQKGSRPGERLFEAPAVTGGREAVTEPALPEYVLLLQGHNHDTMRNVSDI